MIPQRIKIAGFLSYKDEQEIRFDGAPLWLMAGTNGSGKSAIFDGFTYALFGHHRGGSQNAAELINKESNALSVEFDFKLESHLFRIKRTLRRNAKGAVSGTQQIFRHVGSAIGNEAGWEPVPDTGKKVEFDKWIHDKIGLNYDTFTSSVLLLQGKAEKLLDARPSGRAEVLAGIVDLERYQQLHEKANSRKLDFKAKLEAFSHQFQAIPEVTELEYSVALMKIEECTESHEQTLQKITHLTQLESEAFRWTDLQNRLATARQRLVTAESLLGDAAKIEKAFDRWRELCDVLPAVETVVTMRGQYQESKRKSERLEKEREEARTRKNRTEAALDVEKKKRSTIQLQRDDNETKHTQITSRLHNLAGLIEKVRMAEEYESTLRRLEEELARLPADPQQAVRHLQEEMDRLRELDRILPILELFQTERHALGVARETEQNEKQGQTRTQQEGEQLKADQAKLKLELETAMQARENAEQQLAVCRALETQAQSAVAEFTSLTGEKVCRACGQALTEAHFHAEQAKRKQELILAQEKCQLAVTAAESASQQERALRDRDSKLQERLSKLRDEYRDHANHLKQATAEIKRLTDSLALRYAELPKPFQTRIAQIPPMDWVQTTFPERDELALLRRDAAGYEKVKRELRDANSTLENWNTFRTKRESTQQQLDKLRKDLPKTTLIAVRQEHLDCQTEDSVLKNEIKAAKQNLTDLETVIDKLAEDVHNAIHAITGLEGKLRTEDVTRQHCNDTADRALQRLPDNWRFIIEGAGLTEYSTWKSECEHLKADGIETKHRQLEQARGGLDTFRQEIEELERSDAEYSAESRRTPEEVRQLLLAARKVAEDHNKDLREAQKHKDLLDNQRKQREKLHQQFREADGQFNRFKVLAELLGRDRLQRHLVRQAERQIVDYANAILDRLSAGQLFLKLITLEDGADRALELECFNRVTGAAPINVTFLSGSQRFRVAVSLAMAIGQYASRQHRPIESVIIDEGFGCLDRQGRQVMIQELQNLRGHLQCILLVSHQEEFADAFADGYRFELQNGATKVSRYLR